MKRAWAKTELVKEERRVQRGDIREAGSTDLENHIMQDSREEGGTGSPGFLSWVTVLEAT